MVNPALARLAGRPLALAPRALDGLLAATTAPERRAGGLSLFDAAERAAPGYTLAEGGIAVVPVLGPLVTRGDWLTAFLGAMSYDEVVGAIGAAFADPSARAVLVEVDSPGGEVGGLFDLVDTIAALRAEAGKPLWAVARESALSAAYAIASTADRLYVTRTGEVGSVGVVAAHLDESGADAMAGHKWTLIHAGARKTDGNPHEPLSPQAFAAIQADVDALHAELTGLVAKNRGMTPEAVRATEAAIYRGQRGVEAGRADRVGTRDQALADLAAALDPPRPAADRPRHTRTAEAQRRTPQMTTEPTPALEDPAVVPETAPAAPAAPAQPASPPADPAPVAPAAPAAPAAPPAPHAGAAERLRAEYAEIAAIAAQAARLGVSIDAADAMARGVTPEALRRSVLDALAARTEASAVVSAAPQPAAPGDSPIVRRARERAAARS